MQMNEMAIQQKEVAVDGASDGGSSSYQRNMNCPSGATMDRDILMLKTELNRLCTATEKLVIVTAVPKAVIPHLIEIVSRNIYQTTVHVSYGIPAITSSWNRICTASYMSVPNHE
jgi:hypothetical protein